MKHTVTGLTASQKDKQRRIELAKAMMEQAARELAEAGVSSTDIVSTAASTVRIEKKKDTLKKASIKVLESKYELFKNIVYTKKATGDKDLTYTKALHAMIDLYAGTVPTVLDRGENNKSSEKIQAIIISNAMKKRNREKVEQATVSATQQAHDAGS